MQSPPKFLEQGFSAQNHKSKTLTITHFNAMFNLMRIYLIFLACLLATTLQSANIVCTNLIDALGVAYPANSVKFTPLSKVPQAYGNSTVMPKVVQASVSTNGAFAAEILAGGVYAFQPLPPNSFVPSINVLVPPNDTNSYTLNQVIGFATNQNYFLWTNTYAGLLAGSNVTFRLTTNGTTYIDATAGEGSGQTQWPLSAITNSGTIAYSNALSYVRTNESNPVVITNSNNLLGASYLDLLDGSPAYKRGRIFYDTNQETLAVYNDNSAVTMNVGSESWIRVVNKSGSTIADGTPVAISGAQGQLPKIEPASVTNTYDVVGLTTMAITNNGIGYVTISGIINDLDTTAYDEGAMLYLGTSPGTITTNATRDILGICAYSHGVHGKILVAITHEHPTVYTNNTGAVGVISGLGIGTNTSHLLAATNGTAQGLTLSGISVVPADGDIQLESGSQISVNGGRIIVNSGNVDFVSAPAVFDPSASIQFQNGGGAIIGGITNTGTSADFTGNGSGLTNLVISGTLTNNTTGNASGATNLYGGIVAGSGVQVTTNNGSFTIAATAGITNADGINITNLPQTAIVATRPTHNTNIGGILVSQFGEVRSATTPPASSGLASYWGYKNINNATWSGGIVTITSAATHYYQTNAIVIIQGVTPAGYNGTYRILTTPTATTFTYALANNPGTYSSGSDNSCLEPEVQLYPLSPGVPAMIISAHTNSVPLALDPLLPVFGVSGSGNGMNNYGWFVAADGHTVQIYSGGLAKEFQNGLVTQHSSDWVESFTSTTGMAYGGTAQNDLYRKRVSAGVMQLLGTNSTDTATLMVSNILSRTITATNGVQSAYGFRACSTNLAVVMAANTYTNFLNGNCDNIKSFGGMQAGQTGITNNTGATRDFYVSVNVSFAGAGGSSLYEGSVFMSGVEQSSIEFLRDVAATVGSASTQGVLTMTNGAWLDFRMKSPDAETMTTYKVNMTVLGAN